MRMRCPRNRVNFNSNALHAVGAVVSEYMFKAMRSPEETDSKSLQSQINAAIERLDAESWRKEYGE